MLDLKSDVEVVEGFVEATGHLSQEEAATLADVSQRTMSNWRGGKVPGTLSPAVRRRLLKFLEDDAGEGSEEVSFALWGLARARAVEKLAELLRGDQRILELRAEAALNMSRAALREAEMSPPWQTFNGTQADLEVVEMGIRAHRPASAKAPDIQRSGRTPPSHSPSRGIKRSDQ